MVFQADAAGEVVIVLAGLGCENVADFENVVPFRIQVRIFVGLKTNAVAEVMAHAGIAGLFEMFIDGGENITTAYAGFGHGFDYFQCVNNM